MRREVVRPRGTASGARIDQVFVDEAATVAGRSEQRPYVMGVDYAIDLVLAARLCCALQRDRAELTLADDADQLLEDLTRELGRLGVFAALGLVTDEPPADVRGVTR